MEKSGCRSGIWVDASDEDGVISGRCPENLFGNVSSIVMQRDPLLEKISLWLSGVKKGSCESRERLEHARLW